MNEKSGFGGRYITVPCSWIALLIKVLLMYAILKDRYRRYNGNSLFRLHYQNSSTLAVVTVESHGGRATPETSRLTMEIPNPMINGLDFDDRQRSKSIVYSHYFMLEFLNLMTTIWKNGLSCSFSLLCFP